MIVKNAPRLASTKGMAKYVQADLYGWMKRVAIAVNGQMSFDDNFRSFLAKDIAIAAGGTANIPNQLDRVPTERYIVRQTGDGVISDGDWNANTLQLTNNGSNPVVISVRFFAFFEE